MQATIRVSNIKEILRLNDCAGAYAFYAQFHTYQFCLYVGSSHYLNKRVARLFWKTPSPNYCNSLMRAFLFGIQHEKLQGTKPKIFADLFIINEPTEAILLDMEKALHSKLNPRFAMQPALRTKPRRKTN